MPGPQHHRKYVLIGKCMVYIMHNIWQLIGIWPSLVSIPCILRGGNALVQWVSTHSRMTANWALWRRLRPKHRGPRRVREDSYAQSSKQPWALIFNCFLCYGLVWDCIWRKNVGRRWKEGELFKAIKRGGTILAWIKRNLILILILLLTNFMKWVCHLTSRAWMSWRHWGHISPLWFKLHCYNGSKHLDFLFLIRICVCIIKAILSPFCVSYVPTTQNTFEAGGYGVY